MLPTKQMAYPLIDQHGWGKTQTMTEMDGDIDSQTERT